MYEVIENGKLGYAQEYQKTRFLSMDTAIRLGLDSVETVGKAVLDRTKAIENALW